VLSPLIRVPGPDRNRSPLPILPSLLYSIHVSNELLEKARRYNALFMEYEHRRLLGIRAIKDLEDGDLFQELCRLKGEIDEGFRQKAKAEGA
jgi:hypothetical protein